MNKISSSILTLALIAIFQLANAQDAEVTYAELFKSFKQTDKGNCVIVAYIKASIAVLGKDSVFRSLKWDKPKGKISKLKVETWDGDSFEIDSAEVVEARKASKFKILDSTKMRYREILDFAHLCYAVSAKKRQKLESFSSFKASLDALDEGSSAGKAYQYLGLTKDHVRFNRRLSRTKGFDGLIVYNWKHASYAAYGKMDLWGKTKRIRKLFYYGRIQLVSPPAKKLAKPVLNV